MVGIAIGMGMRLSLTMSVLIILSIQNCADPSPGAMCPSHQLMVSYDRKFWGTSSYVGDCQ